MDELGLSPKDRAILNDIFLQHPSLDRVIVYGSRAKGSHHKRSDLDLALEGEALDRHQVGRLVLDLDESDLPFACDVISLKDVKNAALLDHINRVGVSIYQRDS